METLFRFAQMRPAVAPDTQTPPVVLAQDSGFQRSLAAAQGQRDVRQRMKAAAAAFVASPAWVPDLATLQDAGVGATLQRLADALDRLEAAGQGDPAAVADAVQAVLDGAPGTFLDREVVRTAASRLRDSIVAIKLLPSEHRRPIDRLTQALRDLDLLARMAADDGFPADAATLVRWRHRPAQWPDLAPPAQAPATPPADDRGGDAKRRATLHETYNRFVAVTRAIDELTRVPVTALVQSPRASLGESLPAAALRPQALYEAALRAGRLPGEGGLARAPAIALHEALQPAAAMPLTSAARVAAAAAAPAATAATAATAAAPASTLVHTVVQTAGAQRLLLNGRPALRLAEGPAGGFRLSAAGLKTLGSATRRLLEEAGAAPDEVALDDGVASLQQQARRLHDTLQALAPPPVRYALRRVGAQPTLISVAAMPALFAGTLDGDWATPPAAPEPPDPRVPHSFGTVAPVGVMDLLVVRQQLKGYAATDIAHIENILAGEDKEREHRRRTETETISFLETETTRTEERELESTDRFEMTRETNAVLREDASLKAGISISGSYGPTIEFSASAEGAMSRSKEESTRNASTFSKEITQRSASRITERVLARSQVKTTLSIEEVNRHALHNEGGDHVRGIYQWVEKRYEAQLFNVGLRTLFDFMVPEPAAYLIAAYQRAHNQALALTKPTPMTLRADQIDEYNYHALALAYAATDVAPPPEPFLTKAIDFSAGGGDDKTDYNHSSQVTIDEGYRAVQASVGAVVNIWDDAWSVAYVVGRREGVIADGTAWVQTHAMDGEGGQLPFALNTFHVSDIALAVEVKCARTDRALNKWKQETHARLVIAYRARLAEYEEKLAALAAQAGVAIQGRAPAINQVLMRDEVKKACLSLLTDQHFDLFDAIEPGSDGLPQTNLHESAGEGGYVRFFEQAFEWQNMTWLTYPYFWGRKSRWTERIAAEDTDPAFEDFLKAGYCRAVVPVRPGFETAVDHFLHTGDVWQGGALPPITSPLYLPVADELAERLGRPGDEQPEGDPWEVRVPTNLVYLRGPGTLPSWVKQGDGTWLPAPE